ncbi:MAG: nitrate ABC transporter ATP-binding protein, partial [Elioraea sp.]|nr:nitrate ABC transporter ATP-binding protein [Elioraea sp.]
MDEPFSALGVLTAGTLRGDFLELWSDGGLPIRGVVLVTHNIEEAVLMCDRVLVFGSHPGRIVDEVAIALPRPRDRLDPAFRELVERLYVALTEREVQGRPGRVAADHLPGTGIGTVLPRVSSNLLAGLAETLARPPYAG